MAATNQQVQQYVNDRIRPRAEQLRDLYNAIADDKASIDEVYANVAEDSDWTDERSDGPPRLATPQDVLSYNAFISDLKAWIEANANWPIVRAMCVRAL
mgnify:CR=1 FL=1